MTDPISNRSDPAKPVALVPYAAYLTISAGGLGTDISRHIRKAVPEVTNARGPVGSVRGVPALYFRKQARPLSFDVLVLVHQHTPHVRSS